MRKLFFILAIALCLPAAANAVTTIDGSGATFTEDGVLRPGGSASLDFMADGALTISDFEIVAFGGVADLNNTSFSVEVNGIEILTGSFTAVPLFASFGLDFLSLSPVFLQDQDVLQVIFNDMSNEGGLFVSASVTTSPVPLPAAGGMLLTALLAFAVMARRRRRLSSTA